jgi:aspartyl-tRNA(Asn)/glutamyl-tRNA(Gln) amidotransferase subunit A
LFASKGHRTTAGSRILKDNITDYDATAVARLKAAGAILLGKLSMWEFASGEDINPLTGAGPAKNPWNLERSTSGSSTGSGAAVSASLCAAALGSDTGGSIRAPAAFNGIVGLKPTFGRVSRFGATPLSWSLDHVGPMTKSVEDNAIVLEAIAGPDPNDRWCSSKPAGRYRRDLRAGVKGLKIGLPRDYYFEYATIEAGQAAREAISELEKQGAVLSDIELPHLKYTHGVELAILYPETLAYHARYLRQGKAEEYTKGFLSFALDPARYVSAADYVQAQRLRKFIIRDFEKAFSAVDVIAGPGGEGEATPVTDSLLSKYETPRGMTEVLDMWRIYEAGNVSGVPSLALPCGFSRAGLPLSLAIMGKHFAEETVYRAGHAYEAATEWHLRRPPV